LPSNHARKRDEAASVNAGSLIVAPRVAHGRGAMWLRVDAGWQYVSFSCVMNFSRVIIAYAVFSLKMFDAWEATWTPFRFGV